MPDIAEPDRIGRYEHLELIGRGAMGAVYRAEDPHIGRTIAIKVLPVDDPELRARFRQEVRAAGTLTHQHIVAIHDYGETNGRPYIVMEYVDGPTLADVLRDRTPLALTDKLRLMQQLCAALDYAHAHGVIHRDVKPANLMLDRHGDLKVVDFGIAKLGEAELTRTGNVLGTLTYMSPEQVEGRAIDRRSDIFAVGVVLYELMSSRRAFQGDTPSTIMRAIIQDDPVALTALVPNLDPGLDHIVRKALQKDPAQRYQTLAQMATDLARVRIAPDPGVAGTDQEPTRLIERHPTAAAMPPTPPPTPAVVASEPAPQAQPSRARWIVAVAIGALTVAIGSGYLLLRSVMTTGRNAVPTTSSAAAVPAATRQASSSSVVTTSAPISAPNPVANTNGSGTPNASAARAPVPRKIDTNGTKTKVVRTPTAYEQARAMLSGTPTPEQKTAAAGLLQTACTRGESGACLQAGLLYRDESPLKNLPAAAQLFQHACDGGNAEGCNNLASEYARGIAVQKDEVKAASLFTRACDGGVLPACTSLARAYQNGRGVTQDAAQARTLYQKACDGGGTVGCVELGLVLMRGVGGPADAAGAVAVFQQACDKGNVVGCGDLGVAYSRGDGVVRDDGRAVELYQRACDAGGAPACANLAGMYSAGRGVTRDLARAATLLERSCQGNFAEACRTLSQRYEQGTGVERNPTRAAELARRASQLRGPQNTTGGTPGPGTTPPAAGNTSGVGGGVVGGVAGGFTGGQTFAPPPPPPPPPPPRSPVRVGGDIKAPIKTKHANPVYPPIAQSARVQGVVILEAVIGADGKVTSARVLRSIPLLDQAAIDAVKQWEFTPTVVKDAAVPVIMTVTVSFTLN